METKIELNDYAKDVYETNKKNGFWPADHEPGQKVRNVGEMLALVHSEISEALEADRKGRQCELNEHERDVFTRALNLRDPQSIHSFYKANVKDTYGAELAGTIIRVLDIAYGSGIDIAWHLKAELEFNKTREHKHGVAY